MQSRRRERVRCFKCLKYRQLKRNTESPISDHLSINMSLSPRHQGGADRLGLNHASIELSERYRQHSSHSSPDATDVRAARLKRIGAEPGAGKTEETRAGWGSDGECFEVKKRKILLSRLLTISSSAAPHHPKCINRPDEYVC